MTLAEAELGKEYTVVDIDTDDEELKSFLFTLGCYAGETVVLVSMVSKSFVIAVRDGRYNIDRALASVIQISA